MVEDVTTLYRSTWVKVVKYGKRLVPSFYEIVILLICYPVLPDLLDIWLKNKCLQILKMSLKCIGAIVPKTNSIMKM